MGTLLVSGSRITFEADGYCGNGRGHHVVLLKIPPPPKYEGDTKLITLPSATERQLVKAFQAVVSAANKFEKLADSAVKTAPRL